jgi:hypothetical protein
VNRTNLVLTVVGVLGLVCGTASGQKPHSPGDFRRMRVDEAWQKYAGRLSFGRGQCLAILDDGCDLGAAQWQVSLPWGKKTVAGYNAFEHNDNPRPVPPGYHGTTVGYPSSLNYDGVWGVAYNDQVAHVRAVSLVHLRKDESQTLAEGLQWVIDHREQYNITTVNLSPVDDQPHAAPMPTAIDAKLKRLRELGVWVSAPCGNNEHTTGISWPACQPDCFAIGATRAKDDGVYKDRGAKTDILVPAGATSSSNACIAGASMLLREAIAKTGYNWRADGPNLPLAMMRIFQRTGAEVFDPATKRHFKRLDVLAALDHVFEGPETAPRDLKRVVAVERACAWPNLTRMRDGTMVAVIHNEPSHGINEGDADCWASADGLKWEKRGTPAPHEPNTVRMNLAAGLARNGDLVVLCSGWTNEQQPGRPKQKPFRDGVLRAWVCRSADGGRTWQKRTDFPRLPDNSGDYIPFGDIWPAEDGSLRVSCYGGVGAWCLRSDDDGWTWKPWSVIAPKHNETDLYPLGGRRWMAAARIDAVQLFRSDDDGRTWTGPQRVTNQDEVNGHLMRLNDGRLLLSYGVRVPGRQGVCARLSADLGRTWGPPLRLARTFDGDCGYPSSVQRSDGKIVTVYYGRKVPESQPYHMGAAVWTAP